MGSIITYTDNLNNELEAPDLDPQLLLVANEYLAGQSILHIADKFGLSTDRVAAICEKDEVKRYIDTVYTSQGYLNRNKRLELINKVVDRVLEDAMESGVYTKKDLLDWIKLLNEMDRDAKPKAPTTAIQVNKQTNNTYTNLIKDLFDENDK